MNWVEILCCCIRTQINLHACTLYTNGEAPLNRAICQYLQGIGCRVLFDSMVRPEVLEVQRPLQTKTELMNLPTGQ